MSFSARPVNCRDMHSTRHRRFRGRGIYRAREISAAMAKSWGRVKPAQYAGWGRPAHYSGVTVVSVAAYATFSRTGNYIFVASCFPQM